ncbi:nuclear transport factor 2 family protein [Actinocorallia populi]|uniref:nuclear transport factor 2 family protein n=1 Tax=Actinocorallia populi TaxID=2079200 RepID=UPI000D08BE32|nr:nuclear transport factor 2 family protein [Actinocorallia populi]
MSEAAVRALLDKQEIYEVLARYLRAVDRGDVGGVRACYLPGATEDHGGVFTGTADDYVASVGAVLTHPRSRTMHCMTNVLVELSPDDPDTAQAESYVTTFGYVRTPDGPGHSFVGARIVDRMERRGGRWGIAHRALVWDWSHDAPASETWLFGMLIGDPAGLTRSGKYPNDPVYTNLNGAGA